MSTVLPQALKLTRRKTRLSQVVNVTDCGAD